MLGGHGPWSPTLALLGRALCSEADSGDSTFAPRWPRGDEARGEAQTSRPHSRGPVPGSTSVDVARRAAATSRLQGMSISCRCSPPSLAVTACSGRPRPGSDSREPSAVPRLHPGQPPSAGAWPPSASGLPVACRLLRLRACPPVRCPGSGLRRSPRLSTSRALRSPCRSQRSRWRSCLRRHGILLASQVPSRGHLYLYKGT